MSERGHDRDDGRMLRPRTTYVRNRDIIVLSKVRYIMQEVCRIEDLRQWEQERAYNITQHLTGMPGGGGVPRGLESLFEKLSELEERHLEKCRQYVATLTEAEAILNGIQSDGMRAFVLLKYVLDFSGKQVMRELNMTDYAYRSARRCVEGARSMRSAAWSEDYVVKDEM